jgi:hypothetical protein
MTTTEKTQLLGDMSSRIYVALISHRPGYSERDPEAIDRAVEIANQIMQKIKDLEKND